MDFTPTDRQHIEFLLIRIVYRRHAAGLPIAKGCSKRRSTKASTRRCAEYCRLKQRTFAALATIGYD